MHKPLPLVLPGTYEGGPPVRSMIWLRKGLNERPIANYSPDFTPVLMQLEDRNILAFSAYAENKRKVEDVELATR